MASRRGGEFRVCAEQQGPSRIHVNMQNTNLILLGPWQAQSSTVRLWLVLVAVILPLASLRCTLSTGPAPLLTGVRLKGEGCWGAREPAVMGFIFSYSAVLRIQTKQRKLIYLFSI